MNRAKRMIVLSNRLGCFLEQASKAYCMAEKEHKIRWLVNKYNLDEVHD